jgi:hypothetical protein
MNSLSTLDDVGGDIDLQLTLPINEGRGNEFTVVTR